MNRRQKFRVHEKNLIIKIIKYIDMKMKSVIMKMKLEIKKS